MLLPINQIANTVHNPKLLDDKEKYIVHISTDDGNYNRWVV